MAHFSSALRELLERLRFSRHISYTDAAENTTDVQTAIRALEAEVNTNNPHSVTFTQAVAADPLTDITAVEAETLTDGSNADALHAHTGTGNDHGNLDAASLLDDDHTQYALADKSRPSPWVAASDLTLLDVEDLGGPNAATLTDGSNADALHVHNKLTSSVGANSTLVLTDNSTNQTLTGNLGQLIVTAFSSLTVSTAALLNGLLTAAAGITISAGNFIVTLGNATVSAGNLTVTAGTSLFGGSVTCEAAFLTEAVTPAQITADTDDYAGADGYAVARLSTDASRKIGGFDSGADGRHLWIVNVGSFPIVIEDDSNAGGTAADHVLTGTGEDEVLLPNDSMHLIYDATSSKWRAMG
jgi:hypothetical protein